MILEKDIFSTVIISVVCSDEFEEKKNQCDTESQKNNLKTEDVFDEYDR